MLDPITAKPMYVGQTVDFLRRFYEHSRNPKLRHLDPRIDRIIPEWDLPGRRGREELIYIPNGNGPPLNRRRPISEQNTQREELITAGHKYD